MARTYARDRPRGRVIFGFAKPDASLLHMSVQLVIEISDDVLKALVASRNLTITLTNPGSPTASGGRKSKAAAAGSPAGDSSTPREGSLPARILAWAEKREKDFSTADLVKRFKVTRAHASMLLTKLANGPYPIARRRRGVYHYAG